MLRIRKRHYDISPNDRIKLLLLRLEIFRHRYRWAEGMLNARALVAAKAIDKFAKAWKDYNND